MWWRLELDKSGAILSCAHVEMSGTSRGRIRFVEADSDAQACSRGIEAYKKSTMASSDRATRYRHKQRSLGLCQWSGCGTYTGESIHCDKHRERLNETKRRFRRGECKPQNPSIELAAEAHARRCADSARRARERSGGHSAYRLRQTLALFDSLGPEGFRAELVKRICAAKQRHAARAAQKKDNNQ